AVQVGDGVAPLQGANRIQAEVRKEPRVRDEDLGLPAWLVWHGATISLVVDGVTRTGDADRKPCAARADAAGACRRPARGRALYRDLGMDARPPAHCADDGSLARKGAAGRGAGSRGPVRRGPPGG